MDTGLPFCLKTAFMKLITVAAITFEVNWSLRVVVHHGNGKFAVSGTSLCQIFCHGPSGNWTGVSGAGEVLAALSISWQVTQEATADRIKLRPPMQV